MRYNIFRSDDRQGLDRFKGTLGIGTAKFNNSKNTNRVTKRWTTNNMALRHYLIAQELRLGGTSVSVVWHGLAKTAVGQLSRWNNEEYGIPEWLMVKGWRLFASGLDPWKLERCVKLTISDLEVAA